jgi:hypothetical protein
MRWLISILVTTICGCMLGEPTSSTGGAAGSDAGSQCPQTGATCASCTQCALSGPCGSLYNACRNNSDCNSIDLCIGSNCGVGDTSCRQTCLAGNPAGDAQYQGVLQCVDCQQCPTACAGLCPN